MISSSSTTTTPPPPTTANSISLLIVAAVAPEAAGTPGAHARLRLPRYYIIVIIDMYI